MKSNVVSKEASKQKIVVICGPTCVGKTEIALQFAQQFNGEIISADSQQVYRGLDIGTSKPTHEERKRIPHHLIDVVDPHELFHAGRFVELADSAVNDIIREGRRPFVVGGTGLYLKALLHGLCEIPPRDDVVRASLLRDAEKYGKSVLHKRLERFDPEAAEKIHPNHTQRLIRALEIFELTGKSQREFFQQHQFQEDRYEVLLIGLTIDRKILVQRINERVDRMIVNGWVDEVKGLMKKYGSEQVFHAVGYRELAEYLRRGERRSPGRPPVAPTLDEVVVSIKQQTRQYAKRQMTWFRKMPKLTWYTPEDFRSVVGKVSSWYGESIHL